MSDTLKVVIVSFFCWISHYGKDSIYWQRALYWGGALLPLTPTPMKNSNERSCRRQQCNWIFQTSPLKLIPVALSSLAICKHMGPTHRRWLSWGSNTESVRCYEMCVKGKVYACMGLNFNNSNNRIYYLLDTMLGAKHSLLYPFNSLTKKALFLSPCTDEQTKLGELQLLRSLCFLAQCSFHSSTVLYWVGCICFYLCNAIHT